MVNNTQVYQTNFWVCMQDTIFLSGEPMCMVFVCAHDSRWTDIQLGDVYI